MNYIKEAIKQLKLYIEDCEENRSRVNFALTPYWKKQYKKVQEMIEELEEFDKNT